MSIGYQGALSEAKRRSFLIQFYKTVVNDILPLDYPEKDNKGKCITTRKRVPHTLMETYSCTKVIQTVYIIMCNCCSISYLKVMLLTRPDITCLYCLM